MHVSTLQPIPSSARSNSSVGNFTIRLNMIQPQSQPINLAITNGSSSTPRCTDRFERSEAFRQDSVPVPASSSRNANHNPPEQQAQDLSMHPQPQPQQPPHPHPLAPNPLLDFCNIILAYTNYPDAFNLNEGRTPVVGVIERKPKVKSLKVRIKLAPELTTQRRPQKRKIGIVSTNKVKQKPGRKPKAAKVVPPVPSLRPEASAQHVESQGVNGTRVKLEDGRIKNRRRERKVSSPLNSVGESRESTHSSSSSTSSHEERDSQPANLFYPDDDRDESWEEVTCFCGKPFAGRPMIECESCFVWHHMSCAKLRKTNVPKKFYCRDCKHMFPDFAHERPRRTSGNVGDSTTQCSKTPVKPASKNGLSSTVTATTEATTHPPLTVPPLANDQSMSPKGSAASSLYFTPKEGNTLSQFPPATKSPASSAPAVTTPSTQFRNRQHPYLNGNSEPKPVHNSSKSATPPQIPQRKAVEKTKRRPTLNSASSGLYDDVLLPLRLNFSSIGNNTSHNGTSSS